MALQLLKILLNYSLFSKYADSIAHLYQDSKELGILYRYLVSMHEKYPGRDLSIEEYSLSVLVNCQDKDKETIGELLKELSAIDLESIVLADLLADVVQRQKAYELAISALEVSEGKKDFADLIAVSKALTEDVTVVDDVEDQFITTDLVELANRRKDVPGLIWRLPSMNTMFGPIRQGNFGMIVARSNVGKTSFLASEVSFFAQQTDKPILWFNLEQEGHEVSQRLIQAALNMTLTELYSDPYANKEKFNELCGGRIKIYDDAGTHKRQVEQLAEQLKPGLIIFDTLDKIRGFTDDREDLRLGSIYQWGRELAKKYCPVFTVCQASGAAEGKKYLTAEDISNSKTSKIAECDFVLGIGKSHDVAMDHVRHLHSIKNKLPDAVPEYRHGRFDVILNQETGRYMEMA